MNGSRALIAFVFIVAGFLPAHGKPERHYNQIFNSGSCNPRREAVLEPVLIDEKGDIYFKGTKTERENLVNVLKLEQQRLARTRRILILTLFGKQIALYDEAVKTLKKAGFTQHCEAFLIE